MGHALTKLQKLNKDNVEDAKEQKRSQQRPCVAQNGALVPQLEIGAYQLAQKRPVLLRENMSHVSVYYRGNE